MLVEYCEDRELWSLLRVEKKKLVGFKNPHLTLFPHMYKKNGNDLV